MNSNNNFDDSKAGAVCNGSPGERPQYMKGYYAAYVIDPLGNNIEVVTFTSVLFKVLKNIPTLFTAVSAAGVAFGVAMLWK